MNIVQPVSITSLALSGGNTAQYYHPLTNVQNDHPESYFATSEPSNNSSLIAITLAGTIGCVFLVGVVSSVAAVLTLYGGSAPTGYIATSWNDPWNTGRKNYLFTFTPVVVTAGSPSFTVTLGRTGGDTTAHRIGVIKAGAMYTQDGTQYPLAENLDDPTTEIRMADGRIYRGQEMPARRIFSGQVISTRANILALSAAMRAIGGRATMANMAPALGDDFWVYGRGKVTRVTHPLPTYSIADVEFAEIV